MENPAFTIVHRVLALISHCSCLVTQKQAWQTQDAIFCKVSQEEIQSHPKCFFFFQFKLALRILFLSVDYHMTLSTCTLWIESFQNKDHTQGFHEKQETEGNHCLLQSSYLHVANIFGYHRCIVSTKCITVLLFTDSNYILS